MNTLSSQILREIGALSRMIQTMNDTAFKKYDLQKGQFIFITRICENPGINHACLTGMLHVDKGTTTKAVQKLEKLGYIEKRRDHEDSRSQKIYPTALAREVYVDMLEKEENLISRAFHGLSETEQKQVVTLIHSMRSNIEEEWKRGKRK